MAYIIDFAVEWTDLELEQLKRIGAEVMQPGRIAAPSGLETYFVCIEASILELMTPPLCFNCGGTMERNETPHDSGTLGLVYTCACGAEEHCQRYLPEEK